MWIDKRSWKKISRIWFAIIIIIIKLNFGYHCVHVHVIVLLISVLVRLPFYEGREPINVCIYTLLLRHFDTSSYDI
jgi:hypothetical protein